MMCAIRKELRWVLWWYLILNLDVVRQRSISSCDNTTNPFARSQVLAGEDRLFHWELSIPISTIMILNCSSLLFENLGFDLRFNRSRVVRIVRPTNSSKRLRLVVEWKIVRYLWNTWRFRLEHRFCSQSEIVMLSWKRLQNVQLRRYYKDGTETIVCAVCR